MTRRSWTSFSRDLYTVWRKNITNNGLLQSVIRIWKRRDKKDYWEDGEMSLMFSFSCPCSSWSTPSTSLSSTWWSSSSTSSSWISARIFSSSDTSLEDDERAMRTRRRAVGRISKLSSDLSSVSIVDAGLNRRTRLERRWLRVSRS